MLDTHRLRVFRAVVAQGSIVAAADSLGYTPSAISQHLSTLQKETGLKLVERRGRGIVPTAAGLAFAEESADVLTRLADLESVAADLREGRLGRLTLSYFASAGSSLLPPVVAALSDEFPDLRLDLRLIELVNDPLFAPDIEVYVAGDQVSGGGVAYSSSLLLDEPYLAVVPVGHALAARDSIDLVELSDQGWIDNDISQGPCRQIVIDACATVGFSPSFQIEAHDYRSAVALVSAGVGITVLPRLAADHLPPGVVAARVVNPEPRRKVMVRVKDSVRDHPAVNRAVQLLDQLTAVAKDG